MTLCFNEMSPLQNLLVIARRRCAVAIFLITNAL